MNITSKILLSVWLMFFSEGASAQPGQEHFGKVWMQGGSLTYTTTFNGNLPPVNQIVFSRQDLPPYLWLGHANICDSSGNVIVVSDGFNLYDKNLTLFQDGRYLVPRRVYSFDQGFSSYAQSGIILPFSNGKYRLITPTVSDDSCVYNWERGNNWATYDLLFYSELDVLANGGAGRVTKRMEPLLENVRLSKCQMMACRHGDGKSWWLLKRAADTNMYYKFLFTEDKIYGPYIQGFSGEAARLGNWDRCGQSMFSKDGTKFATTIQGYGKVFVADFDRCSGNLSNPKVYKMPVRPAGDPDNPTVLDSSTTGLSFSANNRFLYVCGFYNVHQLDLQNASSTFAWTFLSGPDTTWEESQQYSTIYPGQDDRLYIGNYNGFAGQMSVIDAPDLKGIAAGFCRKCLRFPGFLWDTTFRFAGVNEPPCMPNYALGPSNPICYPTDVNTPEVKAPVLTLYPNPAHGLVSVRCGALGTLQVFDMMGRAVSSMWINRTGIDIHIDISGYAPGIYQCRFIGKDGRQKTTRLIVDR